MRTAAEGPLLVGIHGATARLTLNRPDKKNAISDAVLEALIAALEEAIRERSVRTILIIGSGEQFSAGRDISEFDAATAVGQADDSSGLPASLSASPIDEAPSLFARALTLLLESPKPTVAAVHGIAFGGGQALTLACDFVVAERNARFGNVEMAYGFPAAMNLALLAQHLGRRMAREIAITGEVFSAERYWELGLINRLAEPGQLEAETAAFLDLLNSREPWAVARTKQTIRQAERTDETGAIGLGDGLNQLLFGTRTRSVHSGSQAARNAIKRGLSD